MKRLWLLMLCLSAAALPAVANADTTGWDPSLWRYLAGADAVVVARVADQRLGAGASVTRLEVVRALAVVWTAEDRKAHVPRDNGLERFHVVLPLPAAMGDPSLSQEGIYLLCVKHAPPAPGLGGASIDPQACFEVLGASWGAFLLSDPKRLPLYARLSKRYPGRNIDLGRSQRMLLESRFWVNDVRQLADAVLRFVPLMRATDDAAERERAESQLKELAKSEDKLTATTAAELLKLKPGQRCRFRSVDTTPQPKSWDLPVEKAAGPAR